MMLTFFLLVILIFLFLLLLEGLLPCNIAQVVLKPVAPDTKNVVLVCGDKPGSPTALNVGETNVSIEVTSADGCNKKAGNESLQSSSALFSRRPLFIMSQYTSLMKHNNSIVKAKYNAISPPILPSNIYLPFTKNNHFILLLR